MIGCFLARRSTTDAPPVDHGLCHPLEEVKAARPGQQYTVFSDEELAEIRETLAWLKAAERSFGFWNDPADAIYDEM